MQLSTWILMGIVLLIPILGFILTLDYAKKAEAARELRRRKRHGILFWTFIPGAAGLVTALSMLDILPGIFALIGILVLALSTGYSMFAQKN